MRVKLEGKIVANRHRLENLRSDSATIFGATVQIEKGLSFDVAQEKRR